MRILGTALAGTVFVGAMIVLIICSLCTQWMWVDGRFNDQDRITIFYGLLRIKETVTGVDGSSRTTSVSLGKTKNYRISVSVFVIMCVALGLCVVSFILFWFDGISQYFGISFLGVADLLTLLSIMLYLCGTDSVYRTNLHMSFSAGLWLSVVVFMIGFIGLTSILFIIS